MYFTGYTSSNTCTTEVQHYYRCNCGTGDCITSEVTGNTITYYGRCIYSYLVEESTWVRSLAASARRNRNKLASRRIRAKLRIANAESPKLYLVARLYPPIARARGPPSFAQPFREAVGVISRRPLRLNLCLSYAAMEPLRK